MFVVVEFLESVPAKRAQLRAALLVMGRACIEQRVCHQFDVAQDEVDGSAFLLYEVFENKAAYLAHIERADYVEHRTTVDPWVRTRRHLTYDLITESGIA